MTMAFWQFPHKHELHGFAVMLLCSITASLKGQYMDASHSTLLSVFDASSLCEHQHQPDLQTSS